MLSFGAGISKSDMAARIFSLACHFSSENRILAALPGSTSEALTPTDLKAMFKDISVRLETTFQLTKVQTVCYNCLLSKHHLIVLIHIRQTSVQ